jgi:hypothetical protein
MCNTYCFSNATLVAQTHLDVTLYVHCLSSLYPASPLPIIYKLSFVKIEEGVTLVWVNIKFCHLLLSHIYY